MTKHRYYRKNDINEKENETENGKGKKGIAGR